MIKQLFGLAIGAVVMASLVPVAVTAAQSANTSGFTTAELALWGIVGIVIIGGSLYSLASEAGIA